MLTLNFHPFPQLETNRLLLRELSMNDLDIMYRIRTDPQVLTYLNRDPDESIEATRKKIEEILNNQQNNDAIFWVICWKDDPAKTMIGNIGYWKITKEHYRAEVGYILHPDQWNKGIMKEALDAIIDYGFDHMKLHSIVANINPTNKASGTVLEKCGFVQEAYHKENYYHDGIFYDSMVYGRLNH